MLSKRCEFDMEVKITMNVFSAIISLLTAAFGLATALLGYLKTAKETKKSEKTANGQPAVSSNEEASSK